jgi:phage repressor protein C with HTH and peptisase S24 domain
VERLYKPPPRVLERIGKAEQAQIQTRATPEQAHPNLVAREERAGYVVIRDQDGREVDELVMVPRLDVQVSGGHGATVHSEQIVDSLAFKAAWVRANGLQPSRLALVEAVGESMQPTIQRGDLLLVDLRVNHPAQEGLFVIRRDDTLQVKRLQQLYTGEILVRSDNPAYVAENIPPDRAGELQIIGRVVWTCRRI